MGKKTGKKTGPSHTIDRASGRLITAGPEERDATQPLLDILIREAGWNTEQIVSRPDQWRVPSAPANQRVWPVDVAIFDKPENARDEEHVIILCECKRPDLETGVLQLKIYLDREPHARVGIWFNGIEHRVIYKTKGGYEEAPPGTPIPTPRDALIPGARRPLTYEDLRKAPSLVPVFKRIRDRLATLDSSVNRDEEILPDISLLLLLKILDEQAHRISPKQPLVFQVEGTPAKTANRVREFLAQEVRRRAELFGSAARDIRFQIDDESVYYVVETLQNYRLLSNETDAVAEAFQVIRGKAYKGEEGQYFTPPSVVEVAVAALDPQADDRVIDPACGSGSFLAKALASVARHLKDAPSSDPSTAAAQLREWSTQQLYAIDKDSVSVRLSKAYLSMLGDGSTHVFKADSVRPKTWSPSLAAVIQEGAFDVVVTNPPFGTRLRVSPEAGRQEKYEFSREWKRDANGKWFATQNYVTRDLGLIVLERCIRLLEDGGRMAIVLPDTYLFSDSYGWLVQWLAQFTITHSINVPIEAFEPHCRAKTSVIAFKKEPPAPGHQIVASYCETFGEDKHGHPRFKIADGLKTDERDDEMAEAAHLLNEPPSRESKLHFRFKQKEAATRGVLVASYWWRRPYLEALQAFAKGNDCDLISVGDLVDAGELVVTEGHGSPSKHYHGRGGVPYVKVVDIKNWRINENPSYAVPQHVADKFRRGRALRPYDLVTPTRASKNIGLFGVVMPWQTGVVLTREIEIWRLTEKALRVDWALLLALLSLGVVHDQFKFLVLMQMNREDLGERYKELLLPVPRKQEQRNRWSLPIREYFEATANARSKYEALGRELDPQLFADRP